MLELCHIKYFPLYLFQCNALVLLYPSLAYTYSDNKLFLEAFSPHFDDKLIIVNF